MRPIARDETRHAALAWEVARWAEGRLDTRARARVRDAMREAVRSLRDEVATVPRDAAAELGLPSGVEARALVDAFASALVG
jgi:ribulose kinase